MAEKSVAQLFRHSSFGSTWPHITMQSKQGYSGHDDLLKILVHGYLDLLQKDTPKTVLTGFI